MSDKKGNLVFSTSNSKPMIVSLGDDTKLLITKEGKRIKLVIEAPKSVNIKRHCDLERELAKVNSELT